MYRACCQRNDDISMLTITGFNLTAFHRLLHYIEPHLRKHKRGPSRTLPPHAELSLTLHYLCGSVSEKHLCQIFGVALTTVNRTINRVITILDNLLPDIPEAEIRWPTPVSTNITSDAVITSTSFHVIEPFVLSFFLVIYSISFTRTK